MKLARLHRAGELSGVHVPDATDEAMGDLCRARNEWGWPNAKVATAERGALAAWQALRKQPA